jgi:NADPH-dependent glutamate synthase beta subunit-like oxidoreductase
VKGYFTLLKPLPYLNQIRMTIQIHAKHVAVIGAGVSGVAAAGHLLAAGLDVTVFERNHAAGGVWWVVIS